MLTAIFCDTSRVLQGAARYKTAAAPWDAPTAGGGQEGAEQRGSLCFFQAQICLWRPTMGGRVDRKNTISSPFFQAQQ